LLWLATLRFVHFYPPIAWTLALATVAIAAVLQHRLATRLWTAVE